jgi:UDP-glucose:(heptosyl)LPS alpha-1,3-glucosyltransferase
LRFAFLIFKVFPYGGVQRDMLRIAHNLAQAGHEITILTGEWRGDVPTHALIKHHVLPARGWLNHQRHRHLIQAMLNKVNHGQFDYVVGFNRMANLDAYFAADPCYLAKAQAQHGSWYRMMPRYRFFAETENAVFGVQSNTQILLLTKADQAVFEAHYHTPDARFHLLPPHVPYAKFAGLNVQECRQYLRTTFALPNDANVILTVGSAYLRKGVDRTMQGLASLPAVLRDNTWLIAVGEHESASDFVEDAKKLGILNHCIQAGGRPDVAQLMRGADVLAHPARSELAGIVLIEALVAQLPVIVSDVCGYASHIRAANAGIVLPEPYLQTDFNSALLQLLTQDKSTLKNNAAQYIQALKQNGNDTTEASLLIEWAQKKQVSRHV